MVGILGDTNPSKYVLKFCDRTDDIEKILEEANKDGKSKSKLLAPIYRELFFQSGEDFMSSYYHHVYVLKEKKYLLKYLIIEFFLKRRFQLKSFIRQTVDESGLKPEDNCFIGIFDALLVNYDFQKTQELFPTCLEQLQKNCFYHKQNKVDQFENNCRYIMYSLYLRIYGDSKNDFANFFKNDLKTPKNELIMMNVFVKSKMKCSFEEEGKLKIKNYKNNVSHFMNSVLKENYMLKLGSMQHRRV